MTSHLIIDRFPKLSAWYHTQGKQQENILCDLCDSIAQSETASVIQSLASLLTEQVKSNATENIQYLEDSCSAFACELSQIILQAAERGIYENQIAPLYAALSKLATSTKLTVYCFIAAWVALNCDDPQNCIKLCDKTNAKSSDLYGLKGQACMESQQFQLAWDCFQLATQLAPKDPLQWFWLAKAAYAMGQNNHAWDAAEQCHILEPRDVQIGILLSLIAMIEPYQNQRLLYAWHALWDITDGEISNGYLIAVMMEIALLLRSPLKLQQIIHATNVARMTYTEDLTRKLPQFLRELQRTDFTAIKPQAIDLFMRITNQDWPRKEQKTKY